MIDERVRQVASFANNLAYGEKDPAIYVQGAPHIKYAALRELYGTLVVEVFDAAGKHRNLIRVLDLGAGEGSATLPFLQLGAHVTAVDISSRQLEALKAKCSRFADQLQVRCEDSIDALNDASQQFDVITSNSFLHHIPDYLALIDLSLDRLSPHGQFFAFQDPLRYDTVSAFTRTFADVGYFFWRLSKGRKGDVLGGIKRRLRRRRGVYLAESREDNAEYHVTRNGVDQNAIAELFDRRGYDCRIVRYFSSQNRLFQPIGMKLGLENAFGVIARPRGRVATPIV